MGNMDATYPENTVDDESGGFSAGALGVVVLLAAVPVLLALVLVTGRGITNPVPALLERWSDAPVISQQTEAIEPVAVAPEVAEYAEPDAPERLEIDLLTPRGSAPVYDVGENLEVMVDLSQSAYLYCFYQDGAGAIARVFPNRFQPDAFVDVGQPMTIPGRDAQFRIVFELRGALETIGCIATDDDMGESSPAMLTPDLTPIPVESLEQVASIFASNAKTEISQAYLRVQVN